MLSRILIPLFVLILSANCYSQSVIDSFNDSTSTDQRTYDLAIETIMNVSESKRIFLITNNQDSYARGDFITILLEQKPIARGLVAKINAQISAVKITKIYSIELFNSLRSSMEVQILRGDDSFYRLKKDEKKEEEFKIESEEDLFDEATILDSDLNAEDNKKQVIKNDNLISFGLGLVSGFDEGQNEAKNQQINFTYSYQIDANIWAEFYYGQHTIKEYPTSGIDTAIQNYAIRAKYAIKGPFYTVFMPYIGYQLIVPNSPAAGTNEDEDLATLENQRFESLKESKPIAGVTMLKRLVPGWFVKLELGTDIMNAGLALEF